MILRIDCITVVIIVDPPGDPITIYGALFFRTIVGVIDERGLLFASIAFAPGLHHPQLRLENLLDSLGGSYEKLWPRIGWKTDGVWTRYPKAFTWSLDAPEGHMPLVNQLRGVRLMDAYLNHPFLISLRTQK